MDDYMADVIRKIEIIQGMPTVLAEANVGHDMGAEDVRKLMSLHSFISKECYLALGHQASPNFDDIYDKSLGEIKSILSNYGVSDELLEDDYLASRGSIDEVRKALHDLTGGRVDLGILSYVALESARFRSEAKKELRKRRRDSN
jgi:hypothetical protein